MKHLIIGGVAGGATAAARIRRADEQAEIVLIEKGKYISYANCGLPYYLGGVIEERESLFVQTPATFSRRFAIDVRVEQEVVKIDTAAHSVTVRRSDGSTYTETYDRLLLSPGSTPVRPPLPGIDTEGIFTLRNVEDTDRIKHYMDTHSVKRAVVVGGGFIGLEMAENLHRAGAHVDIVEMADQVMAPVDFSTASHVHRELLTQGVGLYLGTGVTGFKVRDGRIEVSTNKDQTLTADLVLLSIGVRPSTQLAADAGIALGTRGIKVDDYLQTSAPDVYAVGDAIEFNHPLTGEPWLNYLAGPANRQARIVADNMVGGNHTPYEGAIGTAIAKVFGLTVASTGLAAKRLEQLGMDYQTSITTSAAHAGYYPNSFQLTTLLTFDPATGRLYGAQCVGSEGADKRIDQLALIIKHGGTVADLTRLEHAYAPPFSSAKDAIAIAGYAASNIVSGAMPVVSWRELRDMDRSAITLIDTRTEDEFAIGTIPGAINIPVDDLRQRIGEVPHDKPIVVFCAVGLRGYLAQRILLGRGFKDVRNLSGGYKTYDLATAPVDPPCGEELRREEERVLSPTVEKVEWGSAAASPSGEAQGGLSASPVLLDACGLQCPGPILKLKKAMDQLKPGEVLRVKATDAAFPTDARAWCNTTGNIFEGHESDGGYHVVTVRKGAGCEAPSASCGSPLEKNKTLIMFSDDLDKALATFVLANGAAATGHKVSIFFTFWGLNVLKKEQKPQVRKDIFGRMFSWMLPSSSRKLSLSKMSMMGVGDRMMRHIMTRKNIYSLEEMRQQAIDNGVEFIACQMSMDMMGIQREELLDNVTIGGVASYMERAEKANVNLFI